MGWLIESATAPSSNILDSTPVNDPQIIVGMSGKEISVDGGQREDQRLSHRHRSGYAAPSLNLFCAMRFRLETSVLLTLVLFFQAPLIPPLPLWKANNQRSLRTPKVGCIAPPRC